MKNREQAFRGIIFSGALAVAACLSGCGQQNTVQNRDTTGGADTLTDKTLLSGVQTEAVFCYQHVRERDTVTLHFTRSQDAVSGTLQFDNYQIDGSSGTVDGHFSGDTLFVTYNFQAEGMDNTTYEAFIQKGDSLIRSPGARRTEEEGFPAERIDFDGGQVFLPHPCE